MSSPIIVLQQGHVPRPPPNRPVGASGEQAYARAVCSWARSRLEALGADVRIIVADPPSTHYRGDLFYSIHYDSSVHRTAVGASVGYRNDGGRQVATLWKRNYQRAGYARGFRNDNYTAALAGYYGVREAVNQGNRMAAILEGGFGSSTVEGPWLRSAAGIATNGQAIVDSVTDIFDIKPTKEEDMALSPDESKMLREIHSALRDPNGSGLRNVGADLTRLRESQRAGFRALRDEFGLSLGIQHEGNDNRRITS